jgi:hypothetical protein
MTAWEPFAFFCLGGTTATMVLLTLWAIHQEGDLKRMMDSNWFWMGIVTLTAPIWIGVCVAIVFACCIDWLIRIVMTPNRRRKNYFIWELPPEL